ncbi:MAG: class I SAM-dependent methyltransferase [Pacificimonas sp.]|jgi:SAM-dependent methyltransferase|nr:class I SAM-dependent methyltransferase [Pacificimonas sp.]
MSVNWDERYAGEDFAFGTEPNDFLAEHLDKLPKGRTLCLGEGEGRNAVYLAKNGYWPIAVDQSETGLAKARALAEKEDAAIKTFAADLAEYTHGINCWDGAISIFCHLPKAARQHVYEQLHAGLRPRGVFLLEAYRPAQLDAPGKGGPSDAALLPTLAELEAAFEGWSILHGEEVTREVNEGSYHQGESAVVQFIARKPDPKLN